MRAPKLPEACLPSVHIPYPDGRCGEPGLCLGREPGDHQCGTGAQVTRHYRAPLRGRPPLTMALGPSIATSAPKRINSATCMNRDSKMRSVMTLIPGGEGHEGHELCLNIRWKPGVRLGGDVRWFQSSRAGDPKCGSLPFHFPRPPGVCRARRQNVRARSREE